MNIKSWASYLKEDNWLTPLVNSFKENILAITEPTQDEVRCKNIIFKLLDKLDVELAYSSNSRERLIYLTDENIFINIYDREIHVIYDQELFKFFINHHQTHIDIVNKFDDKMQSKFDVFYGVSNHLIDNFLIKVETF
jgi:hypothetical protein